MDEFNIELKARYRRTHYQWIIKGYPGVPKSHMVAVLLELCTHAAWHRFEWMASLPTNDTYYAWSLFADELAPEISSWNETWEEQERRKVARAKRNASRACSRRRRRRKQKEAKSPVRFRSRSPLRRWVPKEGQKQKGEQAAMEAQTPGEEQPDNANSEPAAGSEQAGQSDPVPAPNNSEAKSPQSGPAPAPNNSEAKSPKERSVQSPSRSPSPQPIERKPVHLLTVGWQNTGYVCLQSRMAQFCNLRDPPDWSEVEDCFLDVVQHFSSGRGDKARCPGGELLELVES